MALHGLLASPGAMNGTSGAMVTGPAPAGQRSYARPYAGRVPMMAVA